MGPSKLQVVASAIAAAITVSGVLAFFVYSFWVRRAIHTPNYQFLHFAVQKDAYLFESPQGLRKESVYSYPGTLQGTIAVVAKELGKPPSPVLGTGGTRFVDGSVTVTVVSDQMDSTKLLVDSPTPRDMRNWDYRNLRYGPNPGGGEAGTR